MSKQYTSYCSYCTVEWTDERELILTEIETEGNNIFVIKCLNCGVVTPLRTIQENSAYFFQSEKEAYYEGNDEGIGFDDSKERRKGEREKTN